MSGQKIVNIDCRVIGFSDVPARLLAKCFPVTGEVLIQKEAEFSSIVRVDKKSNETIVVTDAPTIIENWQLRFNAAEHMAEVISIYQIKKRAGLIQFADPVKKYEPQNVLEVRKVAEKGLVQEFDSSSLTNQHIAALLCIWASHKQSIASSIFEPVLTEDDEENNSDFILPFSI